MASSCRIPHHTIRYDTIRYDTIRYDTIRYDTIKQYDTVVPCGYDIKKQYDAQDTMRYDMLRYDTMPYHNIPSYTAQYDSIKYNKRRCGAQDTTQYDTIRKTRYDAIRTMQVMKDLQYFSLTCFLPDEIAMEHKIRYRNTILNLISIHCVYTLINNNNYTP